MKAFRKEDYDYRAFEHYVAHSPLFMYQNLLIYILVTLHTLIFIYLKYINL